MPFGPPPSYVMAPLGTPSTSSTPNATIAVLPNATIDLSRSLKQIPIQVTLNTNPLSSTPHVSPFNSVAVILSYDPHVLTAASLDYSTNVLSDPSYQQDVIRNCLDGHGAGGISGLCQSDDGPGIASFGETILGGQTPDGTVGNIFILTFNVNTASPAFSQIQIKNALLALGSSQIQVAQLNGYYTSLSCGGQACKPAVAKFTWSPQPAKQGQITIFNGSASLPSTGALITNFTWTFGDTYGTHPFHEGFTNSTASYLYKVAGNYSVTLQITDSKGVKVSTTQRVNVINTEVDMGIEDLKVDPSPVGLNPGVVFTISAVLRNFGGLPENGTMTLTLFLPAGQSKLLGTLPVALMKPSTTRTLTATWDSSGKPPNVYRVDASTPILKNETKINNNHKSYWIQLIPTQPGGLSILSVAGISVMVVGAGGFGVSILRKRNLNVDDSL